MRFFLFLFGFSVFGFFLASPVDAALEFQPSSVDFGTVLAGQSQEAMVDLVFTGGGTSGGSITLTPAGGPFECVSGCGSYTLSPSSSSKRVTIRFSPSSSGTFSAALSAGGGVDASIAGTGSQPPFFHIFPGKGSVLDFDTISAGGVSTEAIVVSIDSRAMQSPYSVSLNIGGNNAFVFSQCETIAECTNQGRSLNVTLRPEDVRTYNVDFRPSGSDSATLTGTLSYQASGASGNTGTSSFTLQGHLLASGGPADGGSGGGAEECIQPQNGIRICNPINANTFTELINNILDFIFFVAVALAPLMIVIAGFLLVTGGGEAAKITRAKSILLWTVVGLGIILLSKGLTTILRSIIGI